MACLYDELLEMNFWYQCMALGIGLLITAQCASMIRPGAKTVQQEGFLKNIFRPENGKEERNEAVYDVERCHHYCLGAILQSYIKSGFCDAK